MENMGCVQIAVRRARELGAEEGPKEEAQPKSRQGPTKQDRSFKPIAHGY